MSANQALEDEYIAQAQAAEKLEMPLFDELQQTRLNTSWQRGLQEKILRAKTALEIYLSFPRDFNRTCLDSRLNIFENDFAWYRQTYLTADHDRPHACRGICQLFADCERTLRAYLTIFDARPKNG